jgi:hypothetical protein
MLGMQKIVRHGWLGRSPGTPLGWSIKPAQPPNQQGAPKGHAQPAVQVPATFESGLAYEGRVGSRVPHSSPQEQHPTTLTPHDRIAAEEMKFPGPTLIR